jgi:MtaA/CmuA family methyltransferase
MTGLARTLAFLKGEPVDRPPFHPIVMRWAAKQARVPYRDFCTRPSRKCDAALFCAEEFGLDWVTVMSDPYAEAAAFGLQIEYPADDLPIDTAGHLPSAAAAARLKPYRTKDHARTQARLDEIREFRRRAADRLFVVGWVEGPVAEYADLRGVSAAAVDLLDEPEAAEQGMDVIVEAALEFITEQVAAGAHCIGIGDAFCSQIGPRLYERFAFAREKRMVEHIHRLGALAKLHICGNTHTLLPRMLATGADIIDVDHLVPSMAQFSPLLAPGQVFSGKADPVSVIQDGTPEAIAAAARESYQQARGRCIVSAGCEITPGTAPANIRVFRAAAENLRTVG